MGHRGLLGRQAGTGDWRSILSCIYHIGAVVDPDLRKSETAKKFSIREGKYEKKEKKNSNKTKQKLDRNKEEVEEESKVRFHFRLAFLSWIPCVHYVHHPTTKYPTHIKLLNVLAFFFFSPSHSPTLFLSLLPDSLLLFGFGFLAKLNN